MSERLWWAYGVVRDSIPGAIAAPGIEGCPVEVLRHGGLALLVSPVPREGYSTEALQERLNDLDTLAALARTHEAVLEAALAEGDVVPFRICTVYATRDAALEMLVAEAGRFESALGRVQGKTEWGVQAFAAARSQPPAAEPPSSGTEYLTRRLAQRESVASSGEAVERAAADLHARLAGRCSAAVLSRPQDRRLSGRDDEMILNGAYLVARDDAADFARLVEALGHRHGLALQVTGPWPPYHFAEVPA